MRRIFSCVVMAVLLLIGFISHSCRKDNEIILDKKVIFTILDDHHGWGSDSDTTMFSSGLINFDKTDYSSIDSIFFVISNLKTLDYYGKDIQKTVSIELFDLSNNVSIEHSRITTDDVKISQFKITQNLITHLPSSPINIGIRVINADKNNCYWELHAASLILKRL